MQSHYVQLLSTKPLIVFSFPFSAHNWNLWSYKKFEAKLTCHLGPQKIIIDPIPSLYCENTLKFSEDLQHTETEV